MLYRTGLVVSGSRGCLVQHPPTFGGCRALSPVTATVFESAPYTCRYTKPLATGQNVSVMRGFGVKQKFVRRNTEHLKVFTLPLQCIDSTAKQSRVRRRVQSGYKEPLDVMLGVSVEGCCEKPKGRVSL